jgi:excisionase family DNA binding protein
MSGPLLNSAQCARLLGLSVWEVYRRAEEKQIPHFRLGTGPRSRIRFDPAELDQWLQAQHVPARDETRRLRRRS